MGCAIPIQTPGLGSRRILSLTVSDLCPRETNCVQTQGGPGPLTDCHEWRGCTQCTASPATQVTTLPYVCSQSGLLSSLSLSMTDLSKSCENLSAVMLYNPG